MESFVFSPCAGEKLYNRMDGFKFTHSRKRKETDGVYIWNHIKMTIHNSHRKIDEKRSLDFGLVWTEKWKAVEHLAINEISLLHNKTYRLTSENIMEWSMEPFHSAHYLVLVFVASPFLFSKLHSQHATKWRWRTQHKPKLRCEEGEEECVVCPCKIEGGEEIRELRCDHLFHRVCQDRWLQYKHTTCPLCRGPLARCSRVQSIGWIWYDSAESYPPPQLSQRYQIHIMHKLDI